MRILVVADPHIYENKRLKKEGRALGINVDVAAMDELTFVVNTKKTKVLWKKTDVFATYNIIYLRYFYPYISEALLLAEWAKKSGLRVIDADLANGKYIYSKMYQYWKLRDARLPVPDGFQTFHLDNAHALLNDSEWPIVAKGIHGSKGKYVFQIKNRDEIKRHLTEDLVGFFTFQNFLNIEAEYRVITIGYRAIGAMKKYCPEDDFRHNIAVGAEGENAKLPRSWLQLCEKAARILKKEFAGVDLAIANGKPYILEVNRTPGYHGFEHATKINVARTFLEYAAS